MERLQVASLCNECENVFRGGVADLYEKILPRSEHHTPLGLRKAAHDGCPICTMLIGSEKYNVRASFQVEDRRMYATITRRAGKEKLRFNLWNDT